MVIDNGSFEWPPGGSGGGGGGSGTVTSVAVASDTLTVSGSPITTSGTFQIDALGNANAFAGFDDTGKLYSLPGWTADATGQAIAFLVSIGPDSATSLVLGSDIPTDLTGGVEGIIITGVLSAAMQFNSSYNVERTYASGFNLTGGLGQYQDQSTSAVGSTIQNYTLLNGITNMGATINGFVGFAERSTFQSGGSISGDYHGANITPSFQTGFTLRSFTGYDVNPTIVDPVTADIMGFRVSLRDMTAGTNLIGLTIDVSGSVDSNPQGVRAISTNGRIEVSSTTDMISGQTFQIGNRIESLLHVPSGSPVTGTDSLGNNFAGDLEVEDDLANGPIGIGWNSVGFIASVAVAPGKTVDKATVFLPASSLPDPGFTTGGTFTDFGFIRIYAPLAQGGTAVFGDVYGLQINPQFGNLPGTTGNWGIWVGDTGADNWFAKDVVIGGATGKPTSGKALDVTGDALISGDLAAATVTPANGASGTFTTVDLKTVTVVNGIITSIV